MSLSMRSHRMWLTTASSLLRGRRFTRPPRALEATYQDRLEEYYERIAHHYTQTTNSDKALEYLQLANQKAAGKNAMQEAKTFFDQAIALLDNMPDTDENRRRRISLIVRQLIVFWLLFRVPEYHDLLVRHEKIAIALSDPRLLSQFKFNLGHCQWVFGLFDQAVETFSSVVKLNETAGTTEESGPAYCMLQWTHLYLGNFEPALSAQKPALQKFRERDDLRWHSWSFAAASATYSWRGWWAEAVEEAQKELRLAEEYQDLSLVSFAQMITWIAYSWKGDAAQAIEHAQIAVEKAPTFGDKVFAQTYLGIALCRADRAREAADLLGPILPLYEATQWVPGQVFVRAYRGEAYLLLGELDDAEQTVQKGLELAIRCGMKYYVGYLQRILGEVALKRNPEQLAEPLAAPH
jgi:tetratricopeptide (TPR) repeat protein